MTGTTEPGDPFALPEWEGRLPRLKPDAVEAILSGLACGAEECGMAMSVCHCRLAELGKALGGGDEVVELGALPDTR